MILHPRLARVVADVFQEKPERLTPVSNSSTVPRWDSLGHVRLMLKLEKEFSVKFTPKELMELKSLGDLQGALEKRGALT